jgi:hypothetical protein
LAAAPIAGTPTLDAQCSRPYSLILL